LLQVKKYHPALRCCRCFSHYAAIVWGLEVC